MSDRFCVHIIDDDEAARLSLAFLLDSNGRPSQTYDCAEDFLNRFEPGGPGCIVTDVRMPGMSGLDLIHHLKTHGVSALPIIVITGHGDVPLAVQAMQAGAVDFIEKPFEETRILAALDSCLKQASADSDRAAAQERIATLTGRERDVLTGLMAGHSNKVIAHDLGISPRTVEIYRANLMTKMRAASLSELVRTAIQAER